MKLDRKDWPSWLQHPACVGVHVNGCVERGPGSRFRAKAHAHCNDDDPFRGWICFLSAKRLVSKEICLHELAHLITPGGHTDAWRKTLLEIGGTTDEVPGLLKSYHKRERKKVSHVELATKHKPR